MNRKVVVVVMCAVAMMVLVALPAVGHAAGIATDYKSYAPGDIAEITGFGWQPGEAVSLSLYNINDPNNPYLWYTFTGNPYYADGNGIFSAEYELQEGDNEQTFLLVAEGQTSGMARTVFDDAPHLHFFKDASRNIQRDAFAWGTTVYARADDLGSRPCWKVEWVDPSDNVVETHYLDSSTADDRDDSFVVPASGPSGIWKAKLYRPSTSGTCASGPSFSLRYTLYFDVAQVVIIGADDSYITKHSPDFNSNSSILFQFTLDVNNDSDDTEKTFLRFNIPWLPGDVVSAKLRMRLLIPPTIFGSPRIYNVNRATNPWDVDTITWNNQPGVAGTPTDSQPTPTGLSAINSLMRWNVTSDVAGFTLSQDPLHNYGWRIADAEGLDPEGIFFSTEANTLLGNELYGPVLLIDTHPKFISVPVPAMTEWGMIIFMALAGLGAVYCLIRRRRARS